MSLVLDESTSEGINLEDAVPISDEKGLAQEGYTFRLVNNGSVKASYIITLDDIDISQEEERMSDDILKYSLEKNGEKKEATLITRINDENTENEYIYYFIKNTDDNNVSIYASKIVKEDSKEIMKDLDNEDERQEAYKIFSETYKSLRESEK